MTLPDGSTLRDTTNAYIDGGWRSTFWGSARGFPQPGQLEPGVYTVELSVGGQGAATGEFEIVARRIPTSGPFFDLQSSLPWGSYPLSLEEQIAMSSLLGLMERDPKLASQVASLGWMKQPLTAEGQGTLETLGILAEIDLELAQQIAGASWIADDITEYEWLGLRNFTRIAKSDVSLAKRIASSKWFQDDVTKDERWFIRYLYNLSLADPPLSAVLSGLSWIKTDMEEHKNWAMSNLLDIWIEDRALAWNVLSFPWLHDGLTLDEYWIVRAIMSIGKEDLTLAETILEVPWLADDISEDEGLALSWFGDLTQADLSFAESLFAFEWFADGITVDERRALGWVGDIAQKDRSAAETLLDFPWIQDSIGEDEHAVVGWLSDITKDDPSVAKILLGFPWILQDVSAEKSNAVGWIRDIVREDLLPADVLLGLSWLSDDVTQDESRTLEELRDLGRLAPRVAATFVRMDFFQGPIVRFHSGTIEAVSELYEEQPEQAAQLTSLRWFASGLDYHEAALVLILPDIAKADTLFNELVPTRAARSQLVHLPLAGDVKLTLIRRPSLQDSPDTFDSMGVGLGLIEEFMQVPWPNPDVILLVEPELELARENPPSGFYTHTHMVIDTPETSPRFNYTLYHELGHYYFSSINVPRWLSESGSDFLEFYVREQAHELDLVQYKGLVQSEIEKDCSPHDITNIQDLLDATEGLETKEVKLLPSWPCHYEIGEVLLLHLYESFGRESVSGTLRDLHLLGKLERRPVSEAEIYQAFLANTPPGQEAEFNELYQRLHGGPIPGT